MANPVGATTVTLRAGDSKSHFSPTSASTVPAPVWVEPKGHLLPFCSQTILKHPEKRGTSNYQEGTDIYPSFRTVFARSEGYQQSPETTHNPKVVGSNPTPATKQDEGLAVLAASPFCLTVPVLHPLSRVSSAPYPRRLNFASRTGPDPNTSRSSLRASASCSSGMRCP